MTFPTQKAVHFIGIH